MTIKSHILEAYSPLEQWFYGVSVVLIFVQWIAIVVFGLAGVNILLVAAILGLVAALICAVLDQMMPAILLWFAGFFVPATVNIFFDRSFLWWDNYFPLIIGGTFFLFVVYLVQLLASLVIRKSRFIFVIVILLLFLVCYLAWGSTWFMSWSIIPWHYEPFGLFIGGPRFGAFLASLTLYICWIGGPIWLFLRFILYPLIRRIIR